MNNENVGIKSYCISLTELEVEKAKEKIKPFGGKLSTLLNNYLKRFNADGRRTRNPTGIKV